MRDTMEQREQWLRAAPTPLSEATLDEHRVQQHIAFSLWRIANALEVGNKTLDSMGMNKLDAGGPPGALEMIGIELKELREILQNR